MTIEEITANIPQSTPDALDLSISTDPLSALHDLISSLPEAEEDGLANSMSDFGLVSPHTQILVRLSAARQIISEFTTDKALKEADGSSDLNQNQIFVDILGSIDWILNNLHKIESGINSLGGRIQRSAVGTQTGCVIFCQEIYTKAEVNKGVLSRSESIFAGMKLKENDVILPFEHIEARLGYDRYLMNRLATIPINVEKTTLVISGRNSFLKEVAEDLDWVFDCLTMMTERSSSIGLGELEFSKGFKWRRLHSDDQEDK